MLDQAVMRVGLPRLREVPEHLDNPIFGTNEEMNEFFLNFKKLNEEGHRAPGQHNREAVRNDRIVPGAIS